MKISLEYYLTWIKWALSTARFYKDRSDAAALFALQADVLQVLETVFKVGASCPEGRGVELASRFFKWALKNRDPLMRTREKMEAMQRKWNARLLGENL